MVSTVLREKDFDFLNFMLRHIIHVQVLRIIRFFFRSWKKKIAYICHHVGETKVRVCGGDCVFHKRNGRGCKKTFRYRI